MSRMAELLARMDFSKPGMEKAGQLYAQKDLAGAMDAVIEHFRTRTSPRYLFDRQEMELCRDDGILQDAQDTLDHNIYGYRFPGEIDWFFNPTEHTSHDNEWTWSLYRHIYWQPLARAYVRTGDETYTREFLHQMQTWGEAWPVKPFMEDDEDYAAKYKFPGHSWRTIETAMRLYTVWLPCMEAFRTSPAWDREGWVTFLSLLCDHCDFLMKHYSNHNKSSNWLTMESGALLQCGILFPEIRSDWFRTGYRRVMQEVKYSFDNDGIHMERTPIYHMVAAGVYLQCYRLCLLNGIPVPPYMEPTLEKAARFLMSLVKPDLSTPMIGDADRDDLTTRRCDTSLYEGMNLTFDPQDLNEMRAYFRTWYELTGSEDFRFMATAGKEGTPPARRNYPYISAGIYAMRTGWTEQDSYFHVLGVQLERGEVSSHSHNDTGHVEIHIQGEDILTDSGRYIYNSSCWKDWRHYFLSAKAHNTLYVDDHEMGTVPGVTRTRGVRTYLHAFEEKPGCQLIDISHNGYVFMEDSIFHRRRVARLDGDVFVIEDRLTGICDSEHDIRLYFNFAFGSLQEQGSGRFAYTSGKGRAYTLAVQADADIHTRILEGSEDPIGGWISYGYAWRKPIPQLIVSHRGGVPLRFVTVLAPAGVQAKTELDNEITRITLDDGRVLTMDDQRVELN